MILRICIFAGLSFITSGLLQIAILPGDELTVPKVILGLGIGMFLIGTLYDRGPST